MSEITISRDVEVHVRFMIRRDMREVLASEAACADAWREQDFLDCLCRRNCVGMVAELRGFAKWPVVGHMLYELHKTRLHLLRLAVNPNCRCIGIGRLMVEKLASKLSCHRRDRITLDVRDDNLAAHLWLRACGFRAVNVNGDTYRFVRRLTHAAPCP